MIIQWFYEAPTILDDTRTHVIFSASQFPRFKGSPPTDPTTVELVILMSVVNRAAFFSSILLERDELIWDSLEIYQNSDLTTLTTS